MIENEKLLKGKELIESGNIKEGIALLEAVIEQTDSNETIKSAKKIISSTEYEQSIWAGVVSLSFGITAVLMFITVMRGPILLIFSISGLIAGIKSRNNLKKGIKQVGGYPVTIWGIALSSLHILLTIALYLYVVNALI